MLKLDLLPLSLTLFDDTKGFGIQWHCYEEAKLLGIATPSGLGLILNASSIERYQHRGVVLTVAIDAHHVLTQPEHIALLETIEHIPNIQKLNIENISPEVFAMVPPTGGKRQIAKGLRELRYTVTYSIAGNRGLTVAEEDSLKCFEQQALRNHQQDSHPVLRQKLMQCLEANIVYPPIKAATRWYNSGETFFPTAPEPKLVFWQQYGQPWLDLLRDDSQPLNEVVQRIVNDLVKDFPYGALSLNRVDKTLQEKCIKCIILEQMIQMITVIADHNPQNQPIQIKQLAYTNTDPRVVTARSCRDVIQQWIAIVVKGYHGLDVKLSNIEVAAINLVTGAHEGIEQQLQSISRIRY